MLTTLSNSSQTKLRMRGKVRRPSLARIAVIVAMSCSTLALQACTTERVLNHGAIISQDQLDLVPVGSSRDQVLLALGSPSTTGTFENEIFYYISQKKSKTYEFQKAKLVDQRVVAVYFDEEETVAQVADYGLRDGKVFDFISRTTPTGGRDYTFLQQLLTGRAGPGSALGPGGNSNPNTPPGSNF